MKATSKLGDVVAKLAGGGVVLQRSGYVEIVGGPLNGRRYSGRRVAIQAARQANGRGAGLLNYGI